MASFLSTPEVPPSLASCPSQVGTTLVAITGVIIFWRGVWSVLDHVIGDSVFGDVCCIVVGLTIILGIRISGARVADFWPGA